MAGEKAPKPVEPYEAAKQLRIYSRRVRDLIANAVEGVLPNANHIAYTIEAKRYWDKAEDSKESVNKYFAAAKIAAKTRRVSEIETAIRNIEIALRYERDNRIQSWLHANSAFKRTTNGPVGLNDALHMAKKMVDLAQQLPTVDDLPKSNAENILRAMIATLRYSGIEGTENLQWKEVVHNGETEINNHDGTTEATAAAITAAVGGIGGGGGGDIDYPYEPEDPDDADQF